MTRKKRDTREWVPKFQVPKFPELQVPKFLSSEVLKFRSSQVPGTSSTQVPKFPELQVPKLPLKKVGVSQTKSTNTIYLYNGYFENALDPLTPRPTTLDLMSGSPCSKKIRIASTCPPNTGHSPNAVSMLGQRRRRWANNNETSMGEWLYHHTTSLDVGLC